MDKPEERRIVTNLGPLELAVMNKLWDAGPLLVREMRDEVNPALAITTILTTMIRLFHKGLADRTMELKGHRYSAAVTREAWERTAIEETVKSLPATLALHCLHALVDSPDGRWLDFIESEIRRRRFGPEQHSLLDQEA